MGSKETESCRCSQSDRPINTWYTIFGRKKTKNKTKKLRELRTVYLMNTLSNQIIIKLSNFDN